MGFTYVTLYGLDTYKLENTSEGPHIHMLNGGSASVVYTKGGFVKGTVVYWTPLHKRDRG